MGVKEYEKFKKEVWKKMQDVDSDVATLVCATINKLKLQVVNASSKPILQKMKEIEKSERSRIDVSQNNKKRRISSIDDEEESRHKVPKIGAIRKKQNNISHLNLKRIGSTNLLSKSRFKTPMRNMTINNSTYGMITPKVPKNQPIMLMRRPVQGEMAMSLAGSPLLVSNVVSEEMANVNIPMPDGKLLALLPTQLGKINPDDLPQFDSDTKKQLQMLAENLTKICRMCK